MGGNLEDGVDSGLGPADSERRRFAAWVAREVMPHEGTVRAWLRPRVRSPEDVDDLIQEAYARLAGLTAFDQIVRPGGFFFQTVRNLLIDHIRHERIVRIDAVGGMDDLFPQPYDLNPERIAGDRRELSRVMHLIDDLPVRCRDIFRMRKIDGLSQKEIAARLGVSESIVENDGVKGLTLLMRRLRDDPAEPGADR